MATRSAVPGADRLRADESVDLVCLPFEQLDADAAAAAVAGADALLATGTDPVGDSLLRAAGNQLRIVALAAVGYDNVDLDAARRHGVLVSHTPGVLTETVADVAMALVLMARRRLVAATDAMRAGAWDAFRLDGFLGLDVCGATLGLVGYGGVGQAVARRAVGFGMRVQHVRRASSPTDTVSTAVDLDALLRTSDVVVLAAPLTPQTRHILDAAAIARLKPTATVVNVGRGPLVDEGALLAALSDGRLHSAGLDVFDGEPRDDPDDPVLATPGLVVLPHVGSASQRTRVAMGELATANVAAALAGRDLPTPVPGTPAR